MKTNMVMVRKMGSYDVYQRTDDCYFDANSLLLQWNKMNGKTKREMKKFIDSPKTSEFINEIKLREAQSQKRDMAKNEPFIKVKGKNTKNGKTPDRVWMSPLLFIDFSMWINPSFKYDVLRFVYDQLIEFRHEAGDNYNVLTTSIAKLIDADYVQVAKAIQWIVFNKTEKNLRQHASQEQLKEISDIEKKIAFMIDMNFVNNNVELINALRKMYNTKYSKF